MQQEKRQAVRKRIDQLLYAEFVPNHGSIVLNLSEQGCGFQAIAPIRDRELHFTFAIGGQEIQDTGRVTWLEKTKKVGGLRFINLSARCVSRFALGWRTHERLTHRRPS